MIRIVCGGKKNAGWAIEACAEYEKRLRKPYDTHWEFYDEDKLIARLEKWPFDKASCYVICCDERGKNISSGEYSKILERAFVGGREVVILIGGAYGFPEFVREKADFVWSFSRLVFPHIMARIITLEQTYRASQIAMGGKYHHE
ncbi:23S rRNA (pseudouridine(1915)-N(3))-methyltransferase RlmH [Candidatus Saccharibacteria bacterium]|nr:23S rRNA (pseudouridine(1915)-N(3))-methyltransferase RlmH [Candidatus Saccharibacteria bacterium]